MVHKKLIERSFQFFEFGNDDLNVSIKKYWILMKSYILSLLHTDTSQLTGR